MREDGAQVTKDGAGRSQSGFTLVEALVAMVVLIFGLLAITNLMIVAASSNSVAHQSTAATAVASQNLETLKALPFEDPALNQGGGLASDVTNAGVNYFNDVNVAGVGIIHSRWQITDIDGSTKFITMQSEGTGALARARSRAQFTTFRVENPDPSP